MTTPILTKRTENPENNYFALTASDTLVEGGHRWAVLLVGNAFHLRKVRLIDRDIPGQFILQAGKAHGTVYRPLHPGMTAEDIEGATYARDNGTSWEFAHCSPHEQVDLAVEAEAFASQQFAPAIGRAQIKVDEATNAVARFRAIAKVIALADFAQAVGGHVHTTVVGATLGHYHRNPHNDHKRDLAVAAIAAVLADWKQKALTDSALRTARSHVTADAAAVTTALAESHTIEWRHARVARLAAEAKKKEAAAEEGSGG